MRFFPALRLYALAAAVPAALAAVPAGADEAATTAALKALFTSPKVDPAAFTAAFVQQVPMDGVQSFIDSYKHRLGDPTAYALDGTQYRITSAKGSIGCNIALDQSGKISSLLFHDEMSPPDLTALQKVLVAPQADSSMFEAGFAADVPLKRVNDIITDLRTKYGGFERVDARKRGYYAIFERGEKHAQISVTDDGKIDYLAFTDK